jgi:hypothetical protein
MSFPKDLNSGFAGILRGVPVKTSCPDDPSAANRSQKNTLSYSIDGREKMMMIMMMKMMMMSDQFNSI